MRRLAAVGVFVPPEHPQWLFAVVLLLVIVAVALIWRHGDYPHHD